MLCAVVSSLALCSADWSDTAADPGPARAAAGKSASVALSPLAATAGARLRLLVLYASSAKSMLCVPCLLPHYDLTLELYIACRRQVTVKRASAFSATAFTPPSSGLGAQLLPLGKRVRCARTRCSNQSEVTVGPGIDRQPPS